MDNYGMYMNNSIVGSGTGATNKVYTIHTIREDSEEGIPKQIDITVEVGDLEANLPGNRKESSISQSER